MHTAYVPTRCLSSFQCSEILSRDLRAGLCLRIVVCVWSLVRGPPGLHGRVVPRNLLSVTKKIYECYGTHSIYVPTLPLQFSVDVCVVEAV